MADNIDTTQLKSLELKPEEFYGQKDSFYIRIQYVPNLDGFKFQIWSELDDTEKQQLLFLMGRGLVEACIASPNTFYNIGFQAAEAEAWDMNNKEEMFKSLLRGKPANERPV